MADAFGVSPDMDLLTEGNRPKIARIAVVLRSGSSSGVHTDGSLGAMLR
jgi:hypothetical protein